jgi:phytoene dehydrogenase-like protein
MLQNERVDAVVVGAGPNGLVAAITLAMAGRSVVVLEAAGAAGGGMRSAELTLPGFVHDICSAIHPLAAGSPALADLRLEEHGVRWLHPGVALAHPFDGGGAGVVERSLECTATRLGADGTAWHRHIGGLSERWDELSPMVLRSPLQLPRHPVTFARFGLPALMSSRWLGQRWFTGTEARGLFAGCAAHSLRPLSSPFSAGFGSLLLASAHAVGWPVAEGGSQRIADAMMKLLETHGGRVVTSHRVTSFADIPPHRVVLFDLAPRQVAAIAGDRLPHRYRRRLERYRHGPAAFKIDYALDGPVPWTNEACRRAGTVHVGGSAEEIALSEADVTAGHHPERPFVLVAQQSVVDGSRAPEGKHTLWAYCHVPNGSTVDMSQQIERQIERFAPGFTDRIIARHVAGPSWFEAHDGSFVGGDIGGGSNDPMQLLFRPAVGRPYRTPNPSLYLCSASTPPGAGVHGMCGRNAAMVALRGALR